MTTASPPPTLPLTVIFFPLVGQPRKPGSLRLAQSTTHRPRQRRSAATTTGRGAPGTTALAVKCASPPVVTGHTQSPPAPPRDLLLGRGDFSEDSPLHHLPHHFLPYSLPHTLSLHPTNIKVFQPFLSLFNTSHLFPYCRLTVPYLTSSSFPPYRSP